MVHSYTTGDIIGVALDITNGKVYYSKMVLGKILLILQQAQMASH